MRQRARGHWSAVSEWAYACEGHTHGPRRRAGAFPDAVAVGIGPRVAVLADGQRWRSVEWCKPGPLAGFAAVAGDPSVCVLADPDAYVLAVCIGGQDRTAGCHSSRKPDAVWDAEALPLHPWAGAQFRSRRTVRDAWRVQNDQLVIGALAPTWGPHVFHTAIQAAVQPGVLVRRITDATELVGCDLAVVAAGWATTWEARWSGVPYQAVDLGRRDHPVRANATMTSMLAVCHAVERRPDLSDDLVPTAPDHREAFRAALLVGA